MDRHYPVLAVSTVSPYYGNVALRKINNRKRTRQTGRKTTGARKFHPGVIFWLAFFILMLGLFWVNRETIQKNYTQLVDRVSGQRQVPAPEVPPEEDIPPPPAAPVEVLQEPPVAQSPRETPSAGSRPVTVQPEPAQNTPPAGGPAPSAGPNREPAAEQRPAPAPEQPGRERNIYFTQVDKEGVILRSKTSRKISSSDSPMLDALGVLLQGPTTEEQRRGIVSLIPQGSRILSATVRGSTAYISFSEEFQYNTYGVEGYAAQLKQIVWTATEFPNIQDVQILIEGRRVDYLGEGIWIGSPLSRDEL